jgi:hypothetical protein
LNLQARIDFTRLNTKMLSMLIAAAATRATAGRHVGLAVAGALFWSLAWFACSVLRSHLHKNPDPSGGIRRTSNAVAAVTLFVFLIRLADDSILPALLILAAGAAAALVIMAEKRSHLWLLTGASLAMVFSAAAESRSALFGVCLVWYTLATLDLVAADYAAEREVGLAFTRLDDVPDNAGGFTFAAITLCIALPLYLFLSKPAAPALGHMEAKTGRHYSEPQRFVFDEHGSSQPPSRTADAGIDIQRVHHDRADGNQIVMFVKSSARVYLRGGLYDHFEDSRWTRTAATPTRKYLSQGFLQRPRPRR